MLHGWAGGICSLHSPLQSYLEAPRKKNPGKIVKKCVFYLGSRSPLGILVGWSMPGVLTEGSLASRFIVVRVSPGALSRLQLAIAGLHAGPNYKR